MYTTLRFADPAWARDTATAMQAFADEHRDVLTTCARQGTFPRELYQEMGRRGWIGPATPAEHGGAGGGVAEYCLVSEETGRHALVSAQVAVQGQRWLLDWGTPEQVDRYLSGIARGTLVFSESISEPTMGSSFKNMRASATRKGDDWILDGHKTHVNLGADSDVTLFYGMAEEGLTAFLVDTDTPGITRRTTDPVGLRLIPTADVVFDGVRVPDSAVLGTVGEGMQTFFSTFNLSRLGNASELIGLARRSLTLGLSYASERVVGDNVVTDFQGIQWEVSRFYDAIYGASLARDHAANLADAGEEFALETSLAKVRAVESAEFVTGEIFSLVGGYGLYNDVEFLPILHDVKVLRVAGGSLEILRNHIARRVLRSETYEGVR